MCDDDAEGRKLGCAAARYYYGDNDAELNKVRFGSSDGVAAIKARIDATLPGRTDLARDLAYRAYNIAERKGWTREALVYNTLVQNWAEVERIAAEMAPSDIEQQLGLEI